MMGEYKKGPKSKACLHLANTLRRQALPALEAAIRLPMDPKELLNAKQAMFSLVRSAFVGHTNRPITNCSFKQRHRFERADRGFAKSSCVK